MRIIVVGLGNPILGDDGVGWRVACELKKFIQEGVYPSFLHLFHQSEKKIQIEMLSTGGLRLMEQLVGYDYAIIIDSLLTPSGEVGKVVISSLENLINLQAGHTTSSHDTSLHTAFQMGEILGAQLPAQVDIVGIKVDQNFTFSEALTTQVERSIPAAVETVINLIKIKISSEEYT